MLTPRPYQTRAHDAVWSFIRTSTDPCLVEAATGAGKSLLVAMLADTIHKATGKSVLCLCPSGELVEQNGDKMRAFGIPHSIFSAALGQKSLRHPIVIGTPVTIKNSLSRFGAKFGAIVVDEAHGITPTLIRIIDAIRALNPLVRVIGMTGTPYRLGTGYIFKMMPNGDIIPENQQKNAYFTQLVDRITAKELLGQGYLTPVKIGTIGAPSYDTSGLVNGKKWTSADIDQAYHGHGRVTSGAIADIIAHSVGRRGVMIFCATVQHAKEAYASLPPELSAIVTGETSKDERRSIVARFKAQKLKYLVNVGVFTTGFDASHVDVVALLRRTESAALLQQIIGRGLRLHDDKTDCLLLDYAANLENHFPDGDVFNPNISAVPVSSEMVEINCKCPLCNTRNVFSGRKNPDQYESDSEGYFVDLAGSRIETDHGPVPSHYGRRCMGLEKVGATWERCSYRWTCKPCPHCNADNDIAARYCSECKGEIIDPNEKLTLEFKALKRDPLQRQCDVVMDWTVAKTTSRNDKETWKITWQTSFRSFQTWTACNPMSSGQQSALDMLMAGTKGLTEMPRTVSYRKEPSGFFMILGFGEKEDEMATD